MRLALLIVASLHLANASPMNMPSVSRHQSLARRSSADHHEMDPSFAKAVAADGSVVNRWNRPGAMGGLNLNRRADVGANPTPIPASSAPVVPPVAPAPPAEPSPSTAKVPSKVPAPTNALISPEIIALKDKVDFMMKAATSVQGGGLSAMDALTLQTLMNSLKEALGSKLSSLATPSSSATPADPTPHNSPDVAHAPNAEASTPAAPSTPDTAPASAAASTPDAEPASASASTPDPASASPSSPAALTVLQKRDESPINEPESDDQSSWSLGGWFSNLLDRSSSSAPETEATPQNTVLPLTSPKASGTAAKQENPSIPGNKVEEHKPISPAGKSIPAPPSSAPPAPAPPASQDPSTMIAEIESRFSQFLSTIQTQMASSPKAHPDNAPAPPVSNAATPAKDTAEKADTTAKPTQQEASKELLDLVKSFSKELAKES
ncbi:MAG: hypothetical protein DHS80DRAFT_29757 [Piptocephalis tieghemiana]|nr:MAG: hypothetical protein DHS80DRAFT_29757 [Piptocephalis tieghemiana]